MVGNGVTNWKFDCDPAYFHMAYYHGLISNSLWNNFTANNCNFSYVNAPNPPPMDPICTGIYNTFQSQVKLVNSYNIFGNCYRGNQSNARMGFVSDSEEELQMLTTKKYTPFLKSAVRDDPNLPPCAWGGPIIRYFNDPVVKSQLNIDPAANSWDFCANINYTPAQNATQWIYPILKDKYKMLKYSGDADGAVPTYGTQAWINDLNWDIIEPWRPYYITNMYGQQVGGYVERRSGNLWFVSIHGAGHQAPQYRPQVSYHAIMNFINDLPL
jgi:Serine carboxypeptidase